MPVKVNSTGGGSVTIDVPSTAANNTLTLPARTGNVITSADSATVTQAMLASGVAGNGPSFSAYNNATQTISNATQTRVALNTKEWDTASCFNTTTYRFTPNVTGYYLVVGSVAVATGNFETALTIWKKGVNHRVLVDTGSLVYAAVGSAIVYLDVTANDYIEMYYYQASGGNLTLSNGSSLTYFQAALVRSA